ncbi:putative bifunctional diguanylate cyclase/phosphodiesterase (plasmid) [Cupriavidus basilensis]
MNSQTNRRASARSNAVAAQAEPAHLNAMLDSLTDGFMSVNQSWRFTYLNQTAERLLRRDRNDLLGRGIWDCYPDLMESGYYRVYHEAAASGQPGSHTEYYAPLATWFEARAFPHDEGITILFRDVTREHEHAAQLEYQAGHDHLTGLINRRLCMEMMSGAVTEAVFRPGTDDTGLAVLFLDLDHFKEVNDAFGHTVGDAVLREVAARLRRFTTPSTFSARVGGDEFILVLRDGSEGAAEVLARAVQAEVARPLQVCGRCVSLGASIGIALMTDAGESAEALLAQADTAMYAAKSAGRFQLRVYHRELQQGLRDRLALRGDLHSAFASNQLELHFQPQVATADGSLVGAEALLRWRHPVRGLLAPAAFLDVILDSPMEGALTEWVIDAACRHLGEWLAQGIPVPRISVNLSARQLVAPGLPDTVVRVTRAYGVPPTMLDVEVTENSLMSDVEKASSVLDALKQAGVSTSLDDFGSGYSSLAYLVRLPIDTLKIDKSFVWALGEAPRAMAVISATIGLARSLGMSTLAEGVETEAQRQALAAQGCDAIQGYLVSRPLSSDVFAAFVSARPLPVCNQPRFMPHLED